MARHELSTLAVKSVTRLSSRKPRAKRVEATSSDASLKYSEYATNASLVKRLLHARDHSVAEGLEHIATWNAGMLQASEMAEAFQAKSEKRDPVYQNLPPRRKGL